MRPSALDGWDLPRETRANGHYEFLSGGGLHIWTDSNTSTDKVAGYRAVSKTMLADVGDPSLDYTNTAGGEPGFQLWLDNGKAGDEHVAGYVVGESIYGGPWWSNKDFGVGPGMGYASGATLDEYLAANPDAFVTEFGFSLGSGVKGDGVLSKVTFGCHTWTFEADRTPGGGGETPSPNPTPTSTVPTEVLGEKEGAKPSPSTSPSTTVLGDKLPFTGAPVGAGMVLSLVLLGGGVALLTASSSRRISKRRG